MLRNLHRKLLLLVLGVVGGSMLSAGLALSLLVAERYERQAAQDFRQYFRRTADALGALRAEAGQSGFAVAAQPRVIDVLNLVSGYADIDDYQPLVFDAEKKAIARELLRHGQLAGEDALAVFDSRGWLVAYAGSRGTDDHGILTFTDGQPRALSLTRGGQRGDPAPNEQPPCPHRLDADWGEGTHFVVTGDGVRLRTLVPVYRYLPDGQQQRVGSVLGIRYVDDAFLRAAAGPFPGSYGMVTAAGEVKLAIGALVGTPPTTAPPLLPDNGGPRALVSQEGDLYVKRYALPIEGGTRLFLTAQLDRAVVSAQVTDTVAIMAAIFAVTALLVTPLALWFARRTISRPVDMLASQADAIREGRYLLPVTNTGSRELDTLALALKHAAMTVADREGQLKAAHDELEARVEQRTADLHESNARLQAEIAERTRIADELRQSRGMLQLVIDSIPQYVFWKDRNLAYLGCNANFLAAAGLEDRQQIIGKTDHDMPWAETEADGYRADDRRVMEADRPAYNIQETQVTASGELLHVETNKVPLHDTEGRVIGILGTYQDVTAKRQAQIELLAAKEAAEEASRAKSEFLSRMSHELRTPLNAILGFSQLLQADGAGRLTETDLESITEIRQAGEHLLELISEILDLSRIEVGKLQLNLEDVQLARIVRDSLILVQGLANERQVTIAPGSCESATAVVHADALRLRQVLLNLLSNAVKYNRRGGEVQLVCADGEDGWLRIQVSDTGHGIPAESMHRVFRPFDRLDADQRAIDGTGIGLVITKELVELMGGEIGVHSEPGSGSTFWFTLPRASGQSTTTAATPATPVSAEAVPDASDAWPARQPTVLYVEDNAANYRLVERALTRRPGTRLLWAKDADQGIAMASAERPDLVLMDIQLPGMSGSQALVQLREKPATAGIPVIAVSAIAMPADIRASLDLGFDDYVTKPVDIQQLYRLLDTWLPPAAG